MLLKMSKILSSYLRVLLTTALLAFLLCGQEAAGMPVFYILPLPTDDFCRSFFARELGGCPPTSHDLIKDLPRQPGDKH